MIGHLWLRVLVFTLAFAPAAPVARLTSQSPQPPSPTQAGTESPAVSSIGTLQQDLHANLDTEVVLLGTAVRTSRLQVNGQRHDRFLLRDAGGDTISVIEPSELPPLGAHVRVVGRVAVVAEGIAIAGSPRLSIVQLPDGVLEGPAITDPGLAAIEPGSCADPGAGLVGRALCSVGDPIRVGSLLGVLILAGVAATLVSRRRRGEDPGEIPLIVALETNRTPQAEERTPTATQATNHLPVQAPAAAPPHQPQQPAASGDGLFRAFDDTAPEAHSTGRLRVPRLVGSPSAAAAAEPSISDADASILQLLPGRLEVLQGHGLEPQIRFFRTYSQDVPEITFGRSDGPAYRHVKLEEPTVSRLHARLRFRDRRWRITSLSSLNPVLVNGQELCERDAERTVADGDRIEMGTVVFVYRESR